MRQSGSDLPIYENIRLAPYTTLGVGGPARFLIKAKTEEDILDALAFARERGCPVFVLGGGSNIIVSDSGFQGLVLKIELQGLRDEGDGTRISVGAGVQWDAFVQHCVDRNLAGIECLSGIPGTVGGTPVQNVGAYGEEVSDVILKVRALDRGSGEIAEIGGPDCGFAYRSSIFNTTDRNRYVILGVDFALRPDGRPHIQYRELRRRFNNSARVPALAEVRQAVLQIRETKAMVLNAGDPDSKSAGSFFKNPVLNADSVSMVEKKARSGGLLGPSERIPRFAAPGGEEKLPAAWLVEHAGFHKGYAFGRAGISSKHALALVNRGGATAKEILDLAQLIQTRVMALFGVDLKLEPELVGFAG